jgi:putative ABC transport system permease protein
MLWNAFTLAVGAIARNLVRSCLTMLGIVIGVAAVITMVTVGNGATVAITQQIEGLGTNLLIIVPSQGGGGGGFGGFGVSLFTLEDADAIGDQVSAARSVAPVSTKSVMAIAGNESWRTTATGVDGGYQQVRDWPVAFGRDFNGGELQAGAAVCIIGATIRSELFGRYNPVGDSLRLGRLSCTIIGVLDAKGQSAFGQDQDNLVLLPMRTFQRRVAGNTNVQQIMVSVRSAGAIDRVQEDIEDLLRDRRRISEGEDDDFAVQDTREMIEAISTVTGVLTSFLSAIAGVSLLVGGIGIMNIMLVSVTERTREIGTRLAIGALERDVLLQFLVEASVLAALGGVVGVLLALGLSALITNLINVPLVIDLPVIGLAVAFSAAVGLFFGLLPAQRAASLNPIEALRHE